MMRFAPRTLGILIAIVVALTALTPARADAHGIGGLEPSDTNAEVISVTPVSKDFVLESVENGGRVRLTRTGSENVYVLGVDGEQYIRITNEGTYLNQKSATRLINQSTNSKTSSISAQEYKATSSDPDTAPVWKKVSDSTSYIWHDHRTHYMGSVPEGETTLGTNTLPLRIGTENHTATFEFYTTHTPNAALPFVVLGIFFLAILLAVFCFRKHFLALMNKTFTVIVLIVLAILEAIHIVSYMSFAQQSLVAELTASIYGLIFIGLILASIYKIFRSRNSWTETLRSHAPLLSVTGFVGLTAGTLIEYRALIEPFPASTLSSTVVRSGIVLVGCLSSLIFAVGAIHIKENNPAPTTT